MNLLVDRQHADLLYSIQRLFEDRLDVDVWVPCGHEWWDAGYWRFGQGFGDDRLAKQFLEGDYRMVVDGQFVTYDTAHPERPIAACSLEAAREMPWDFVMASVPDNQQGFARFARERDARYLYHIGNTGQFADMMLNPTIINTSEFPVPKGVGVTIHQEIDSGPEGAFAFRPPAQRCVVRNFVNAFNRLPGYEAFLSVEQALNDIDVWEFTVHGHEGRDGFITPASAQGAAMASAGFGWHDKPVGDGFGHVIHGWAAVGRPLIGRAAFYRGKLAEPFWTPETSIDITGMAVPDVVREMQAVASDADRHAAMCYRIREVFDSIVDYEAEAESVRALLGL